MTKMLTCADSIFLFLYRPMGLENNQSSTLKMFANVYVWVFINMGESSKFQTS